MEKILRRGFSSVGYDFRKKTEYQFPSDFSQSDIDIITRVKKYTMTSSERMFSLLRAVDYTVQNSIEGDIVECGVWRGGSIMLCLLRLMELGDTSRDVFLYDTFEGMTQPTEHDISYAGQSAIETIDSEIKFTTADFDFVKKNVLSVGYPKEKIHFVRGPVEETIPKTCPDKIALLRLDTDWYESTKHEMNHLYPRLTRYGALIIDDYGHWTGAKKAVDEYIQSNDLQLFLSRIDYTGRVAIKV